MFTAVKANMINKPARFLFFMFISAILLMDCTQSGERTPKAPAPGENSAYTVTFNTNGAAAVPGKTVNPGGMVTEPDKPSLTGCSFGGWFIDNGFGSLYDFSSPLNSHITLHAKWIPKIDMAPVQGGSFLMGSDDYLDLEAKPVHKVTLSGFYIAVYEITQAQYRAVTGYNPSEFISQDEAGSYPVENITWFDAVEFCNRLSGQEGLKPVYAITGRKPAAGYPVEDAQVTADWKANGYRLPSEAEWEYAAKGGNGMGPYYVYSGSNDAGSVAWYNDSPQCAAISHPVGKKKPNGLGIYDMSGNVWEWCWDWYDEYTNTSVTNPKGPSSGPGRVIRGGSWSFSDTVIRIAYRNFFMPAMSQGLLGIRLVRTMQ